MATGATGGDNEEGAPDVHYQWRPPELLAAMERHGVVPPLTVYVER